MKKERAKGELSKITDLQAYEALFSGPEAPVLFGETEQPETVSDCQFPSLLENHCCHLLFFLSNVAKGNRPAKLCRLE